MKEWGGVLGTIETNTKVPTPSGLIEERQLRSYLFNFPSHLSPMQLFFYQQILPQMQTLLFSKNGYFEAVNIQIMHSVSRSGSL